ncbi:MAG: IS4 family transposase, partial [Deltaproteobacteria bacterium]|nr:IS4 family transposase [Deltaproteobacteria bacterium]MBW2537800.1 IS4 family transposase [Deltaproteobacteria bacterium]
MASREDTSLRRSLATVLTPKRIRALARELGVVQRRRKIDIVALVYSLALGFAVGGRR